MSLALLIPKILLAVLQLGQHWLERQDAQRLRDSGADRELARAAAKFSATLRQKNAVLNAVHGSGDDEWLDRLLRDIEAGGSADK